ncbi:MAG: LysE family translocator [Phyllobacteriaceae bacterium]|jgi:threonine/homoserine/homoserine lactone efflux protein|nr:LysE family translocator [Phyllobacteriaceae bacterium]
MLWSFLIASILIELTPGPNMTWLAVLGASRGRATALAAVAGICLGLAVAASVAGFGLTAVLLEFPALFQLLRWGGTLYLFYLAWDAWSDGDGELTHTNATRGVAFRQGLISNILNPKAYLFYAAMLPQFVSGKFALGAEVALLSAIYVAVATVIHAGIALLSGSLATFLETSPHAISIRKGLAVLIALAAIWFFYSTQVST